MKKILLVIGLIAFINGCQKKECNINDPNCKAEKIANCEKCKCNCEKCCCCIK